MDPLRQASHRRFTVRDQADVGELRRWAGDQARRLGATPQACAVAQLVATELGANLVRHATAGGWMLARPLPPSCIELIAVDRGPGIADLDAAMAGRGHAPGGHPSGGLGCGLAAVRRASRHFDVYSSRGRGTTVLAVVDLSASRHDRGARPPRRRWAGISVGVTEPCGDAWMVAQSEQEIAVAVVDGLGHGPAASVAADAAAAGFAAAQGDPGSFLTRANTAMRGTRGGAATVCQLQRCQRTLRYVAVGNVNGCVVAASAKHRLLTYGGTLGLRDAPPSAPVLTCQWPEEATLVLWTDGLRSQAAAQAEEPGLLAHDPAVIAATLYRDQSRGGDDATVVVVHGGWPP